MTIRKSISGLALGLGLMALPFTAEAANFFSPSQAQLNSFVFTDYWAGNGATLNSTSLVGADGVQYNFNTGFASPNPDTFSRTQFTLPFTQDLTGYGNIGVAFQVPAGGSVNGSQLWGQVDLHYASGQAFSGWTQINSASRTNVYLDLGQVPPAQLSQINSIDLELRSDGDPPPTGFDVGDKVNAFVAPAPPSFADSYLIAGFEGTGSGSTEGWDTYHGPATYVSGLPQPDHVHHVVAKTDVIDNAPLNNGVTQGTHALQITRNHTGNTLTTSGPDATNYNFRWGSTLALNSSTGTAATGDYNNSGTVDAADYTTWRDHLGQPGTALQNRDAANTGNVAAGDLASWKTNFGHTGGGTDPAIQAKINTIVDAINNGDQIAIDVSLRNNFDVFPPILPAALTFLSFDMYIQDGSGGFFQASLGAPSIPPAGQSYTVTLSANKSKFVDQAVMNNRGNLGTYQLLKNSQFSMGISTNITDGVNTDPYLQDIFIDNIRVRKLVAGSGAGEAGAVPEPSTAALCFVAIAIGMVCKRRK